MKFNIRRICVWALLSLFVGGMFTSRCLKEQNFNIPETEPSEQVTPAPTPGIVQPPSLALSVSAIPLQPFYLPDEDVKVRIIFENGGSNPITIRSFPPEMRLTNPTWGVVRTFPHSNETIVLEPGGSLNHSPTWDQRDENGDQVRPGYYSVEVCSIAAEGIGLGGSPVYPLGREVARVLIQHPQGALEKHIDVHQLKTVDGVTVVLEDIECFSTGAQAHALVQLPGRPPSRPEGPPGMLMPEPTPPDINPTSHYRVDGGPEQEFMSVGFRVVEDDTRVIWDMEPVPSDAGELNVMIARLGAWEGPWEFRINLAA